jgi:hypothetical protein
MQYSAVPIQDFRQARAHYKDIFNADANSGH